MARVLRFLTMAALVSIVAMPVLALEGNVDAGKKVFAKCGVCHGIGEKKASIGPSLNNVVGRPAATQPDYLAKKAAGYSKAMIAAGAAGLVWTDDQILEWITAPAKKVPGTKMAFPGLPKEQDRADVLAYVKTFTK